MSDVNRKIAAKSDDLSSLLNLTDQFPGLFGHTKFVRFKMIVDANKVLSDIKFLLTKADAKGARTSFLEILEAESIECYAPTFLKVEINKHIPLFAVKYGFSIDDGFELWGRFSKHIKFVEAGGPEGAPVGCRDPKDWPYVHLYNQLGHPVVTRDKDILAMGAATVNFEVVGFLKDYARETASVLTIVAAGGISITLPSALVSEGVKFISTWLGDNVSKPPKWVWTSAIFIIGFLVMYKPSRTWLMASVKNMSVKIQDSFERLYIAAGPVITDYQESSERARIALANSYKLKKEPEKEDVS